jgi:hypothetical protein
MTCAESAVHIVLDAIAHAGYSPTILQGLMLRASTADKALGESDSPVHTGDVRP